MDTTLSRPRAAEFDIYTQVDAVYEQSILKLIESYLRYYGSGDSHTAKAKRYDLNHFLEFIAAGNDPNSILVSAWTVQATKDFLEHRLSLGDSPASASRRLATLKHFGRTLAERVSGFINPAREVKAPTFKVERPLGLSEEELRYLRLAARELATQSKSSFSALRNANLLDLILLTGLRLDEVRTLLLSQISQDLSWLKNVRTKGKKFRNVYISEALRPLLEEYLIRRNIELEKRFAGLESKVNETIPVFVSFQGATLSKPLSFALNPKTIWRIIYKLGEEAMRIAPEAGSKQLKLHPHKLRHTFAHVLLESSRDVRLVAQALGHSDVRTTMRYTERSDEEVAGAIEQSMGK